MSYVMRQLTIRDQHDPDYDPRLATILEQVQMEEFPAELRPLVRGAYKMMADWKREVGVYLQPIYHAHPWLPHYYDA